ncbi:uncharacterized protein LOC134530309 isoform X2 [Bacillus rossius redtenbacheri]|uniref:uncharacterized protein LOC134530309 isoform X2 n=1 Tax=Bacillus rossius redtenbacheri TaxID=93214 RepID=UPI002FDE9ABD
MSDTEDDDTHVCLKCRATIIGLDDYVAHRRSSCAPKQPTAIIAEVPDAPAEAKEAVDDPGQRADDFFSCLELQSSAKKSPLAAGKTQGKSPAQAEFLMGAAPDADLPDGCLMRPSAKPDKHGVSIADGLHLGVEEDDEEDDSNSNDDYGVEYGDLGELDDAHGDYPPRSHTGGKWSRDLITSPPRDWGLIIDDCRGDTPPPNFTGGKWKPSPPVSAALDVDHTHAQVSQSRDLHSDDDDDAGGPPPGHTSGKWVPGKRPPAADVTQGGADGGAWCEPCQLRLSSAAMLGRHVRSRKHLRTAAPEEQSETATPAREKRTVRRPQFYFAADTWVTRSKVKAAGRDSGSPRGRRSGGRGRDPARKEGEQGEQGEQGEVACECCGSSVPAARLGEHLLSFAHYWNMRSSGRWDFLLRNMAAVVRLARFQCALCRFYCNTAGDFLLHWRSPEHKNIADKMGGGLTCSACRHEAQDADAMGRHVAGASHARAAAGEGGPAVVARRRRLQRCGDCGRQYRYLAQMRRHLAETGHGAAPRDQKGSHPCLTCDHVASTAAALREHSQSAHRSARYFCGVCRLRFATAEESARHRASKRHHELWRGITGRPCRVCGVVCGDLQALRDHVRTKHPDRMLRCNICGKDFALLQDLMFHMKKKECTFVTRWEEDSKGGEPSAGAARPGGGDSDFKELQCKHCLFTAKLKSDVLYHQSLHSEPVMRLATVNGKQTMVPFYSCSECDVCLRKSSLRHHVRVHAREKLFECRRCDERFAHPNSLLTHERRAHGDSSREFRCADCDYVTELRTSFVRHCHSHSPGERVLACHLCDKKFAHKHNLSQHVRLHAGKKVACPVEGCFYACRCQSELRNHLSLHSDSRPFACGECGFRCKNKYMLNRHAAIHRGERPHACPHCQFASRLSSHLRRHARLHTGARPYHCPHCDFRCNVLENLRKHVLTTKKHAGKKLYECRFCDDGDGDSTRFATNLVKSFRAHLLTAHKGEFESQLKVSRYITGVYHGQEDPLTVATPLPAPPARRRRSQQAKRKVEPDDVEDLVGAENVIYVDLPGDEGPVAVSVLECSDGDGDGSRQGIIEETDPETQTTVLILDLDNRGGASGSPRVVLSAGPGSSAPSACLGLLRDFCAD